MWSRIARSRCFATLHEFQRQWIGLMRAVAARDAPAAGAIATELLETQSEAGAEVREYLLMAALAGHLGAGRREAALEVWSRHGERARAGASVAFRLLRCHARDGDCAREFGAQAR
jgi:hypothetical protein